MLSHPPIPAGPLPSASQPDFQALLDQSVDAHLVVAGETGNIWAANAAVQRLLGYSAESLLGTSVHALLAEPEDRASEDLPEGHDAVLIFPMRCRDGSTQEMDLTLSTVPWGAQAMLFVTLRQTRERGRQQLAQATRERRETQAEQLRSVGTLAAGIAHDFNNLLTHIVCNADMAREEMPAGAGAVAYLSQIDAASHRASELCRQLLAYAGESAFRMELLDLTALVQAAEPELRAGLPENLELELRLPLQPMCIWAEGAQIRQALGNLVQNAIEALGGQPGRVAVVVQPAQPGQEPPEHTSSLGEPPAGLCICLEVVDDGCGMTGETRRRVFDPFFSTKFLGRGLGLAAVWGIARRHEAHLRVRSQPGAGTQLQIFFPSHACKVPTALAGHPGPPRAVLLLEPADEARATTAGLLKALGLAVLPVRSLREAINSLRAQGENLGAVLLAAEALEDDPASLREWVALRSTPPLLCLTARREVPALLSMLRPAELLLRPLTLVELRGALRRATPLLMATLPEGEH